MKTDEFVIVGGGLAAATAAETLRSEGFDGTVRMLAAERELPYLRPPLSKEYFLGKAERDTIFVHPADWYDEQRIEVELGATATGLDTTARRVVLEDGRGFGYDRLLLATGAAPRRIGLEGASARGIHSLRTVDDSESLRGELAAGGKRVVFIGSGWIGLEIAAAARGYGNDVTIVDRGAVPLSTALGDELGTMFRELHEQNGVVFRLSTGIKGFTEENGRVTGVVTDTETLPADLVVIAVGAVPNVALAETAGLALDNGLLVDEALRSSDPRISAAGDLANAYHPVLKRRMRNEHWANAIGTGKVAARSMLDQDVVFDEIPYFYTDQYDLGMEYSGYPPLTPGARIVYRGDRAKREFVAFWLQGDRVVAGMNVNVWDVNEDVQALIRRETPVDPAKLADADVSLASL